MSVLVFDLDGTLIDSVYDIADCTNAALRKFSRPARSVEEIKKFIGNGAKNLIRSCLGEDGEILEECLTYYKSLYAECPNDKTGLFRGVGEMLESLKKKGHKLAILTNKPQEATEKIYEKYLSRFAFDRVVGQSANVKCKPDKTAVLKLLSELDGDPADSFMIGDGEADVMTAANAGMRGISVLWGYRTREQLSLVGAKTFALRPSEIENLLTL